MVQVSRTLPSNKVSEPRPPDSLDFSSRPARTAVHSFRKMILLGNRAVSAKVATTIRLDSEGKSRRLVGFLTQARLQLVAIVDALLCALGNRAQASHVSGFSNSRFGAFDK
jgi:hypothetical protein